MLWYQKEYANGDLYKALWSVALAFSSEVFKAAFFKIERWKTDSRSLESMVHQLCSLVVTTPGINLTIEQRGFTLKEWVGQDEVYYTCRRTNDGWLFKAGRSDGSDLATPMGFCVTEFGWRKLSNDHPLSGTAVAVGPSRLALSGGMICPSRLSS